MSKPYASALLTLVALATGCVGPDRPSSSDPAYVVRDSAGVRIVESTAPTWEQPWVTEEAPLFRVGDVPGQPEYELYRVSDAVRLSDGRLVIANSGTGEMRWYSESGEFLRSSGGIGEGPGEFNILSRVVPMVGDSLAAGDLRLRRLSVFGPEGNFVRSVSLRDAGLANPIAQFNDGTYLLTTSGMALGADGPTRIERVGMTISGLSEIGEGVRHVASIPWIEVVIGPTGGVRPDGSTVIGRNLRRFGRGTWVAGDSLGWVVGDNARAELQLRSPAGELVGVIRWPGQERAVTESDVQADRELALVRIRDPAVRRRVGQAMDEHPAPPETMPPFGSANVAGSGRALLIDAVRNVWVKEYSPAAEEDPNRFLVFDPEGIWLGVVAAPPGLEVLSIGSDYVIGLSEDEFGVEVVSVHRLEKPN